MNTDFLQEVPSDLRIKIEKITSILPDSIELFHEVYNFALNKGETLERKKPTISKQIESSKIEDTNIIFKLENASILSPIRKKLDFLFHLSSNSKQPMISLVKNSNVEYSINDLKTNIKMATFLPVPEKSNIVYLYLECKSSKDPSQQESILMALNKNSTLEQFIKMGILPNNEKDFKKCKDYMRKQAILTGFRIIDPFSINGTTSSNNIQGQLKSFHVECHRGTKEGTLYFLPDHILFGFKKPILVFQSTEITSITYSSITRLTFNMTLITSNDEKFEFSMIDQSEYAKIDEYVKTKQVIDKSMSEELKAKKLKTSQQNDNNGEDNSALKDAVAEMNGTVGDATNINNLPEDSDDEENDQDFQAESDLSDGSENEEDDDDEDGNDNGEDEAEEVEEDEEEEGHEYIKETNDVPQEGHSIEITEDISSETNLQLNYPSTTIDDEHNQPNVGSLEDIVVDLDDEDEDDEDDSGVEYD